MNVTRQDDLPLFQMLALKDVFRRTGAVHELQRVNLWAWGQMVAPHLVLTQVEIKPESYEVVFDYEPNRKLFKLFRASAPKNFQDRLKGLQEAVGLLFGDDYQVLVRVDGAPIFSGSRKVAPVAKPTFEGVDFEAGRLTPSKPWVFSKEQKPPPKTP